MRISHRHKFIFLSKPKCASTSIRRALNRYSDIRSSDKPPYHHHTPASMLKKQLEDEGILWNDYFKFTCVRNPWDLVVSLYSFAKPDLHGVCWYEQNAGKAYDKNNTMPFNEWVKQARFWDRKLLKWVNNFSIHSLKYFACDNNANLLVDYVIRVEDFNNELKYVSSVIGIDLKNFTLNASIRKPYQEYYDNETKEIVARDFEFDISYGKYLF